MLTQLSIKNYALIDDLRVDFSGGLTTITGETGAGKSILLESLGLVLGNRADRTALRDADKKCVVEAEFAIGTYPGVRDFFEANDLDYETQTLLRREIRPNGKSRAFINDSPVTLDVMQQLGHRLIDVHSQHQTLELTERDFQLRVVDALAGNTALLETYRARRFAYLEAEKRLADLQGKREVAFREQDYNEFLLEELRQVELEPGLQEELEEQQATLSNSEQIIELLGNADQLMQEENYGLLAMQARLRQITSRLSGFGSRFGALHDRVQSLAIEADDIAGELGQLLELQQPDPDALEKVNAKLRQLYDLQKKHHVNSVEALLEIRETLSKKVHDTAQMDTDIADLEEKMGRMEEELDHLAAQLNERRAGVLPGFTEDLRKELVQLGIPNASFTWELLPRDAFGPSGKDVLELLFSANKGGSFGSLKKTASGGELSRIMLAIKAQLAAYEALPTMMFDEIDTGVSGEISNRMGDIMRQMSRHMQVFAITHLPQVASKGHLQYKVYKEDVDGRTHTRIKLLTQEERILELAQMLGGSQLTDTAMTHARELLN
ncbi:DNA repair protein RecN [Robiginitalea sp. SC105]|uniref:DNA repair protein RecN n=1 Tax=Robiginitalea sp. SC105 TaxID=2762332 RepID=UPI00163ADC55|nr:DNA repair protein RecN [Robiginitalea sp. SC105]MBC2840765.1 DNA repair protein RecN [Robiginitalea sp. SC105]